MQVTWAGLLVIFGFTLLIGGAHYLIEGATALARKFRISEIAIGLTVISFGTSAPELAVNILASLKGNDAIIFGNIIGSNLMNLMLVLGVSAVIFPLNVKPHTIWREIPYSMLAIIAFLIMANDQLINGHGNNILEKSDGLILLLFFGGFLVYALFKIPRTEETGGHKNKGQCGCTKMNLFLLGGMGALAWGGQLVVDNATIIAQHFGASQKFIGLTLVAGGTSLPELMTSVLAAMRKKEDLAVGNIIGSNIFNLLFILGIGAVINPLSFEFSLNIDILLILFASLFLMVTLIVRKRLKIERWMGIVFLVMYVSYFSYLFIRK